MCGHPQPPLIRKGRTLPMCGCAARDLRRLAAMMHGWPPRWLSSRHGNARRRRRPGRTCWPAARWNSPLRNGGACGGRSAFGGSSSVWTRRPCGGLKMRLRLTPRGQPSDLVPFHRDEVSELPSVGPAFDTARAARVAASVGDPIVRQSENWPRILVVPDVTQACTSGGASDFLAGPSVRRRADACSCSIGPEPATRTAWPDRASAPTAH